MDGAAGQGRPRWRRNVAKNATKLLLLFGPVAFFGLLVALSSHPFLPATYEVWLESASCEGDYDYVVVVRAGPPPHEAMSYVENDEPCFAPEPG